MTTIQVNKQICDAAWNAAQVYETIAWSLESCKEVDCKGKTIGEIIKQVDNVDGKLKWLKKALERIKNAADS